MVCVIVRRALRRDDDRRIDVVRPDKQTFAVMRGQGPLNAKLNREEGMWPYAQRELADAVMFGKHRQSGSERVRSAGLYRDRES